MCLNFCLFYFLINLLLLIIQLINSYILTKIQPNKKLYKKVIFATPISQFSPEIILCTLVYVCPDIVLYIHMYVGFNLELDIFCFAFFLHKGHSIVNCFINFFLFQTSICLTVYTDISFFSLLHNTL